MQCCLQDSCLVLSSRIHKVAQSLLSLVAMPFFFLLLFLLSQINRILHLAQNTRSLMLHRLDTTSLLQEVNMDYARTMNQIIFDVNLRDPSQTALRYMTCLVPALSRPRTRMRAYMRASRRVFFDRLCVRLRAHVCVCVRV